ncbi:MAG: glycogen-binding domain-containing protein, partial [Gemmatimonadota bacterium]
LLFLIGLPGSDTAPPLPGTAESAGPQPTIYVQFRLDAPGAQRVELAGSFTDWAPAHQLHETGAGVWTVVVPLEPGVHDYTFVIDGERWIVDPNAPSVEDDFGGSNSRLFLPAPVQGV